LSKIITTDSLQPFFFKRLTELNKKSLCPIPEEIIFYSSDALNRYTLSTSFFEESEGKLKHKTLGVKLLETGIIKDDDKIDSYREIGDSALILSGYFSSSINERIVDRQYYYKVGQLAYQNLDSFVPSCFNVPSFYKVLATCFENMAELLKILSDSQEGDPYSGFLVNSESKSKKSTLIQGVTPNTTKKAS
jgi:hypothetical protein